MYRVRITSGDLGGRFIKTVSSLRPTSDLVRKALFDILGDLVEGTTWLDLYAGSGAVGLEAISHGASQATLVDNNREHIQQIKNNAETLGVADRCVIRSSDVSAFLESNQTLYDFVFADPWYEEKLDITNWLTRPLLTENGMIIVEHNQRNQPTFGPDLRILNSKRYGDTTLTFYTRA
jgi:16S rRNA (guanine966-N2)-methyltransferase